MRNVIVIGSGNLEFLLRPEDSSVVLGSKHRVTRDCYVGGSGVNISRRLLSRGIGVLPVLSIGDDDAGHQILHSLASAAREGGIDELVQPIWSEHQLVNPAVQTPTSAILVHSNQRTIFQQRLGTAAGYLAALESRFDQGIGSSLGCDAVVLGHVPAGQDGDESAGATVKRLIEKIPSDVWSYVVLGGSQLRLGWEYWKDHLCEPIDVLQLNLKEAQRFFAPGNLTAGLSEVLDIARSTGMSVVLTLDRFGAIAIKPDDPGLWMVWPVIRNRDVQDATGAGDAFAAGAVAQLVECSELSVDDYTRMLQGASHWAGAACATMGGSGSEPGAELQQFLESHPLCNEANVEVRKDASAQELVNFLGLAFQ